MHPSYRSIRFFMTGGKKTSFCISIPISLELSVIVFLPVLSSLSSWAEPFCGSFRSSLFLNVFLSSLAAAIMCIYQYQKQYVGVIDNQHIIVNVQKESSCHCASVFLCSYLQLLCSLHPSSLCHCHFDHAAFSARLSPLSSCPCFHPYHYVLSPSLDHGNWWS